MTEKHPGGAQAAPRTPSQPANRVLLVGALLVGAVAAAALTAFALRGHASHRHLEVAVGLPLAALIICVLAVVRRRLARLSVRRLLAAAVMAVPGLAIIGPVAAFPHLRSFFALRMVLILIVLVGAPWLIVVRRRWRLEAPTFAALYAAWFAWLVITLAWAPDRQAGLHYLLLFAELGAIAVAAASAGTSRRRLRGLLLGLALVLGLALLVATAEWTLHIHLPSANPSRAHPRSPEAFFYNTNDFATYLALCWPFVLLLPAWRRTRATTALTVAAVLASTAALLFSGSRASLLTFGLETVIVVIVVVAHGTPRVRRGAVVLVVVVVLGAGVLLSGHGGSTFGKFTLTKIAGEVRSGQGSGGVRFDLQIAGLHAAATRYFLGVGPGNVETVVGRQNLQFTIVNVHDWWLEVFADGGLPALLIFITIYLMALRSMVRVARWARDPLLRYLGLATAVSLAGFTIAMIGPSTAIKFPPMAILLGLAVAVLIRERREEHEQTGDLTPAPSLSLSA